MTSSNSIDLPAIGCRLRSELKLKLTLSVVLYAWVFIPYFLLQRHHLFTPIQMVPGHWDRLIPFSEGDVWIYLSVYLLMPIGPYLMRNRLQIVRYALGIMVIGICADAFFLLWPTWCSRPEPTGNVAAYAILTAIDNPFHAFPSLHAAFAVYSACCAGRVFRELGIQPAYSWVIWFWAFLILLATLATKQHTVADIAAGSVLAFGVYICAFIRWNLEPKTELPIQIVTINPTQPDNSAI